MTVAADLVVDTSAGATAAAQVRSGMAPAELLASVLAPPVRPVGQNQAQPPSLPTATVFERMRAIGTAATSAADLRGSMGAFGAIDRRRRPTTATAGPLPPPPPPLTAAGQPPPCFCRIVFRITSYNPYD
jgi:hypothetical protein